MVAVPRIEDRNLGSPDGLVAARGPGDNGDEEVGITTLPGLGGGARTGLERVDRIQGRGIAGRLIDDRADRCDLALAGHRENGIAGVKM